MTTARRQGRRLLALAMLLTAGPAAAAGAGGTVVRLDDPALPAAAARVGIGRPMRVEAVPLFAGEAASALELRRVFAVASTVYRRDVDTALQVHFLSIWATPADPFSVDSGFLDALYELGDYWHAAHPALPRTIVHLLSGRDGIQGGIAYRNDGNPCWNGPVSLPPDGGSIMSYCHLLPGGYGNVTLSLGEEGRYGERSDRVLDRIFAHVLSAGCLLDLGEPIFEEGFESGDTTAWPDPR